MSTLERIPQNAARKRLQETFILLALGAAFLLVLATTLGLVSG